jgi:AraC family transcriptional regulator
MAPRDGTADVRFVTAPPARRKRPPAATCVLAGTMPVPLLSSRTRGWAGVTVELHAFDDLDTEVRVHDHVVALHLAGNVTISQGRDGRTRTRAMHPGDVTITPAGPPTHWRQPGHSLVVLVRLSPAYVAAVAGDECALDPERFEIRQVFSARDATIEEFARGLLSALELEGVDGRVCAETLACELAIHLLREHTTAGAAPVWPKARLSPHKLRRAIEYIDDNLRNELQLAAIAHAVALSPGHFAHAFRQATGVSPHRYIVERRVEHAKALLRGSDLPITEIAHRVGCASHSHFSVMFHRVTGVTPRGYRDHS